MYRVVIADDSAAFLEWLKSLFESSQHFQVIGEANDGAGVLEAVEASLPDLVLADVEMPAMDGIDLARIIAGQWPNIGVILTSSNNEPFYYQAARQSKALAFIPKIDLSLAAIQRVLRAAGRQ
jgi:YesN/AraC family two-component response regulator